MMLAVVVGAGFSVAVFFVVRWWESRDIAAAFQAAAEDRSTAVKGAFDTEVGMLELVRSSLMADGKVERDEFRETLAPFLSHPRSIQAVEWVPRVAERNREEFEAIARRNGEAGIPIYRTRRQRAARDGLATQGIFPDLFHRTASRRSGRLWL